MSFLGKMVGGAAKNGAAETGKKAAVQMHDLFEATRINPDGLPLAPRTAFRKRPVKLTYDKNEYYTFRLPSEDAQLMGPFDKDEIFGRRQGVNYSPHIKSQVDLDTKMLWGLIAFSLIGMMGASMTIEAISPLRKNYRNSTHGRFTVDDFVEKKL